MMPIMYKLKLTAALPKHRDPEVRPERQAAQVRAPSHGGRGR